MGVYILGQEGRTRLQSVSTGSTNQLSWTVATGNFSQNEIQKFLYFVEVVEGTLAEAQQAVSKYTGRTIAPELLSGLTAVDFLAIQTYNVQGVSAGPSAKPTRICASSLPRSVIAPRRTAATRSFLLIHYEYTL